MQLVNNAKAGCQVWHMTIETGYGACHHSCAIDDGKKSQPR